MNSITWMPGVFSPRENTAKKNALRTAEADLEVEDKMQGMQDAKAATARAQQAALMQGRRRAGGSTFRRSGTVMPQVSGLEKANRDALRTARRSQINARLQQQYGDDTLPPLVSPNLFWMNT